MTELARTEFAAQLGPRTRALVDRDSAVFFHQAGSSPCLAALRAVGGPWLEDLDGRRYLDLHGNTVHHLGHAHAGVLAAIQAQLAALSFSPRRYTNETAVLLAERLLALWPGREGRVLFATGGSDAIEIALKLARVATRRHETVSLIGSYHGDGLGARGLAGDRAAGLGPLLPGQHHVPPFWLGPDGAQRCLDAIATLLAQRPIGAVIVEPIRSTPHIPPPWLWAEIRRHCDRHGTLLIFDEIPTGLGKTGRWFASEHAGVVPDMTVLGKSLGGGILPIAAVIGHRRLDVAPELNLGHYTHEKNPVTAAAALATLQVIESEKLVTRSAALGAETLGHLQRFADTCPAVDHARGLGMLLAVQLRDGLDARRVFWACLARGVSLTVKDDGTIGISPPLTIAREDLDHALGIICDAIASLDADGSRS